MEAEEISESEWYIDQVIHEEVPSETLLRCYKYGFAYTHSGLGDKYEVILYS